MDISLSYEIVWGSLHVGCGVHMSRQLIFCLGTRWHPPGFFNVAYLFSSDLLVHCIEAAFHDVGSVHPSPCFNILGRKLILGHQNLEICVAKTSQQRKPNSANQLCNFLTTRHSKKEITLGPWAIHSVSAHLRIIGGPSSWLGGVPNWHEFYISSFAVIELKLNPQIHYHLHKCTEVHFKFSSVISTEYS